MNTKRTLSLRKEVLVELSHGELEAVVGASFPTWVHTQCNTCSCVTCPDACLSVPCPTITCE